MNRLALALLLSCSIPATAQVAPVRNEDFSFYRSSAELRSDPRDWYDNAYDRVQGGQPFVFLDTVVKLPGHKASMRYDFPASWNICKNPDGSPHNYSRGRRFNLVQPKKEIWVEAIARFEPGFKTNNPNCTTSSGALMTGVWKFLFGLANSHRFHLMIGLFGSGKRYEVGYSGCYNLPPKPPSGPDPYASMRCQSVWSPFNAFTDGQWHMWRLHMKQSSSIGAWDGDYEIWMDTTKVYGANDIPAWLNSLSWGPFRWGQMGATFNVGPARYQRMWWGNYRYWDTDPGWH